ncbi:MAG: hypothetical protein IJB15_12445, partial [Clostridia bacterium]|nr:hypothetical protein [Clostridia bacterium]
KKVPAARKAAVSRDRNLVRMAVSFPVFFSSLYCFSDRMSRRYAGFYVGIDGEQLTFGESTWYNGKKTNCRRRHTI